MRFIGICLVLVGILTVLQVEGAKKKKNIKSTVTTDINGASSQVSDAGTPILSNADKRIAEMVPIRFDLIDSNDKPPPKGILFSWHSITSHGKKQHLQDGRFHDTVGTGNEFKVAVKSCHEAHPEIPIYLITNAKVLDRETRGLLHRVYEMDLMQESGLLQLYQETGDIKFGFGTKAYSVIRGWELGLLPDWVIHFDVDITIVSTSNKWNLHTMFEPLQFYDIAGVMEGYSTCLDPTKPDHTLAVGGGWEMNTGAFAVKRSAKILLEKWVEVFKEDPDRFAYFQSGEQQGMSSKIHFCIAFSYMCVCSRVCMNSTDFYSLCQCFRVLYRSVHVGASRYAPIPDVCTSSHIQFPASNPSCKTWASPTSNAACPYIQSR